MRLQTTTAARPSLPATELVLPEPPSNDQVRSPASQQWWWLDLADAAKDAGYRGVPPKMSVKMSTALTSRSLRPSDRASTGCQGNVRRNTARSPNSKPGVGHLPITPVLSRDRHPNLPRPAKLMTGHFEFRKTRSAAVEFVLPEPPLNDPVWSSVCESCLSSPLG